MLQIAPPLGLEDNPLFTELVYLYNPDGVDLNVLPVYEDYTGKGVTIGIADTSIDPRHPDLAPNYLFDHDYDFVDNDDDPSVVDNEFHGTAVAGVAAGANNDFGVVGVAYDANIAGLRVLGAGQDNHDIADMLFASAQFDIVNHSYGVRDFGDNPFDGGAGTRSEKGYAFSAETGRDGLGTVHVLAAGNDALIGSDSSSVYTTGSRYNIAVGAVDENGVATDFTTPGPGVLVSAFGDLGWLADPIGAEGAADGDFLVADGTSFASPAVAGVAALMLEANPDLGYRDVQKILALSARITDLNGDFQSTGAENVNGGGFHYSHTVGYGVVDATAAVRLAETWTQQGTAANEVIVEAGIGGGSFLAGNVLTEFVVQENIDIQHIEIDIGLATSDFAGVEVFLVSPNGTVSRVFDTELTTALGSDVVALRLNSVAHLFEESAGTWQINFLEDSGRMQAIDISDFVVRFIGDKADDDDTYFYTDEFVLYAGQAARADIVDDAGYDTINAAAVTSDTFVDLEFNEAQIAGVLVDITDGATIERVFTGDGADVIFGGHGADSLHGGRGADEISGGQGDDLIEGGKGDDFIEGGAGADTLNGGEGIDVVSYASDKAGVYVDLQEGFGARGDAEGDELFDFENVIGGQAVDVLLGDAGANRLEGRAGDDWLAGGDGGDDLAGGIGDDWISGGRGNDVLSGGAGADTFFFADIGREIVTDFNAAEDRLEFGSGVASGLSDFWAQEDQGGLELSTDAGSVYLVGVQVEDLSADLFAFV